MQTVLQSGLNAVPVRADKVIGAHKIGTIETEIQVCCLVGRFGAADQATAGITPIAHAVALILY